MSYHIKPIMTRGVFGQPSKIREELEELEEAIEQDNPILIACELSDLYGALEAVAANYNWSMDDLVKMAAATKRSFMSGERMSK